MPRAVVTGDDTQVDLPEGRASGTGPRGGVCSTASRASPSSIFSGGRRGAPPARAEGSSSRTRRAIGSARVSATTSEPPPRIADASRSWDDGPSPGAAVEAMDRAFEPQLRRDARLARGRLRLSRPHALLVAPWRVPVSPERLDAGSARRGLRPGGGLGPRTASCWRRSPTAWPRARRCSCWSEGPRAFARDAATQGLASVVDASAERRGPVSGRSSRPRAAGDEEPRGVARMLAATLPLRAFGELARHRAGHDHRP